MWSQANMKHKYEIFTALNKEKHQVVNFLWQHLLKWTGQCVPRMTSETSDSSKVFRAVVICLFKRLLTPCFYWSSSSCWIKFVNHWAIQVTDLKTAEPWGLLTTTTTTTKEKPARACGEVIWPAQSQYELNPPRAPRTACGTTRNCWHQGHRCCGSQGTGGGCRRRRRMKTGAKQTFRNIPAVSKALLKFDSMLMQE